MFLFILMGSSLSVLLIDIWSVVPYYTARLCSSLRGQGVNVAIASMTYDLDPQCFRRVGIRNNSGCLDVVGRRRLGNPLVRKSLKLLEGSINLLALSGRFLFFRPEVIHLHHIHFSKTRIQMQWWFLKYVKMLGIKLVYTVHNVLPHEDGESYRSWFTKLYQAVDGLICHSEIVRERMIQEFAVPGPRLYVIPHGPLFDDLTSSMSETQDNPWTREGRCLIVCQGIIRPYKGVPFLLDAWSHVERASQRAWLIVAGLADPEYALELQEYAKHLALRQAQFEFRFLGAEEMVGLLSAAEILAYPYRDITTSGALMTGLALHKPIVATDLPPFRQLLKDEKDALLVPYGDISGMARSLLTLIESAKVRHKKPCDSKQEEDPWAEIARQTQSCYECVINGEMSAGNLGKTHALDHELDH